MTSKTKRQLITLRNQVKKNKFSQLIKYKQGNYFSRKRIEKAWWRNWSQNLSLKNQN